MKTFILALGLSLASLAVGCGGTSTFSCDIAPSSGSRTCTDYDGVSGDTEPSKAQCTQHGGTVGTKCNTAGSVGGCRLTAPAGESGTVTLWYFSPNTASTVMQSCGQGTFVSP